MPGDKGVLGAGQLSIGPIAKTAAQRIADQERASENGRPNGRPEPHGEVCPTMIAQAVELQSGKSHSAFIHGGSLAASL